VAATCSPHLLCSCTWLRIQGLTCYKKGLHGSVCLPAGQRTFGKGVVQYYFPMADGSGLKLTIAKYLTPDGYDITKQGGMAPDLLCDDYPHGIFNGSGLRPGGKPDACVLQALDAIMADKGQLQQKKLQIDPEKLKVLYAGRL
jgi:hypothetical protein